ncbi:hypothetical protein RB653_004752 [Dictyostelium firmibasis]|uniref:Uncharacterized protein n=1 Tax=Dictyostelium firmibasis TaxID=79012 RepID=A0AAN7Z0E2_9MYCE
MNSKYIKAVTIGDGAVGKTSLLVTKYNGTFPFDYTPTVIDSHITQIIINDQSYDLCCWDTGGGEKYARLRPLSYLHINVFVICFSVSSRESYYKCETYWSAEVTKFFPSVPIILVGTKIDLREFDDNLNKSEFITYEEGIEMKDKINASAYIECSSLLNKNLNDLFEMITIVGNNDIESRIPRELLSNISKEYNNDKKKKCIIC